MWDEQDIADAVGIPELAHQDPDVLNEEFQKLPAQTAYWAGQYTQASEDSRNARMQLKDVHAELVIAYSKRITRRDLLSAAVQNDARRRMAEQNYILCDRHKQRLWGVLESLKAKREALITIGANLRSEISSTNTSINQTPSRVGRSSRIAALESKLPKRRLP